MARKRQARRLAIASGKGGVGKTFVSANLAAELAARGLNVLVLDADLGLANLDVILDVRAKLTLHDFVRGTARLSEVVVATSAGFDLLPAGSGVLDGTLLTPALAYKIESALHQLESRYDVMLFDLGAGIGDVVMYFARLAHDVLLVVTPEPTALADVYAVVKILALRYGRNDFSLVVNQASRTRPDHEGMKVANQLRKVAERFLIKEGHAPVKLHLIASIPSDPAVPQSIAQRRVLGKLETEAPAANALRRLAAVYGPDGFSPAQRQP